MSPTFGSLLNYISRSLIDCQKKSVKKNKPDRFNLEQTKMSETGDRHIIILPKIFLY